MTTTTRRMITAALFCACLALLSGATLMAAKAADQTLRLWVLYEDVKLGFKYNSLGQEGVR